jgi:hydrogenase/urease accessory protein HupE
MQNRNNGEGLFVKIREKFGANVLLRALPYTLLISALTIVGLFGGFALGRVLRSSIASFAFSLSFSFLGFFFGLFLSYFIVKRKYPLSDL